MHDPINRIKELAGETQGTEALELFTQIFALEERLDAPNEAPSGKETSASLESKEIFSTQESEGLTDLQGVAPSRIPFEPEPSLPLAKVSV
ncbi:hypothetical protein D3C73_1479140 [compost metagenome]